MMRFLHLIIEINNVTAKATIIAAIIAAVSAISIPFIQKLLESDDKSATVSECNSNLKELSAISGNININNDCSKNYNPEYESEFNIEVERLSGRKIDDVSFFSDPDCTKKIPSEYDQDKGVYKIFQKMNIGSSKFIYIHKDGFECFQLSIQQNQKNAKAKLKVNCQEPNSSPECAVENKQ